MRAADDAVAMDTSNMTPEEVYNAAVKHVLSVYDGCN